MMKRIFGLLAVGCVLYACSPILKYGKYSRKCRGRRGSYECSYIAVNQDTTYEFAMKALGSWAVKCGKWSQVGNTLYVEDTIECYYRRTVGLDPLPPERDTFIIKKNRLMRETQKFKWREKGEHMYKDYKGSKTRTKYKFVPAEN